MYFSENSVKMHGMPGMCLKCEIAENVHIYKRFRVFLNVLVAVWYFINNLPYFWFQTKYFTPLT